MNVTATARLRELADSIGCPLSLRYDPDGQDPLLLAKQGNPDVGRGPWSVVIPPLWTPPIDGRPLRPVGGGDALAAGATPLEATRNAEIAVQRRLANILR